MKKRQFILIFLIINVESLLYVYIYIYNVDNDFIVVILIELLRQSLCITRIKAYSWNSYSMHCGNPVIIEC